MKIIKPYYVIRTKIDGNEILKNIEEAGRTCYKSEDKITTDSAKKFVAMLLQRGHTSVLEHALISVKFVCDRAVGNELVRHRIASYSQTSTRYCNYSQDKFDNQLTFIQPCWIKSIEEGPYASSATLWWLECMQQAENNYLYFIGQEWKPEEARSVLPLSLMTEIVMTANLREWREVFRQRTAKAAHPQMRELMRPLLDELKTEIPVVFDDIVYTL